LLATLRKIRPPEEEAFVASKAAGKPRGQA
jgi:hypothetical protein